MQNIRIIDLNTNDIVKFQITTKEYKTSHTGIVTRVYAKNEGMQTKWYDKVLSLLSKVGRSKYGVYVRAIYSYRNKTTLKHLHHITDIPLNTLCYQKENGVYNEKLRCFLLNHYLD